jgi:glucose/arabinose dehydrogenase/cytochrome c2
LPKKLLYFTSIVGCIALLSVTVLFQGLYSGWLTPEKLRRFVKYNPVATSVLPKISSTTIETIFYHLLRKDVALAAMGQGLESGGGAITETQNGILIAEKTGRFFFLDKIADDQPRLRQTKIFININQEGFEREAKKQGYAVKPGANVGYAGLGMRVHDLLLLSDKRHLLASYTRWHNEQACAQLIFSIADLDQTSSLPISGPWQEIFKTTPCLTLGPLKSKPFAGHQAGGRMIELSDGKILVTVGDFKNDGDKRSLTTADLSNSYGKTHLIDLRTKSIQENFTVGHRNPQGLVLRQNGEIWLTEHGPTGGDEINQLQAGANYGWPKVTLGKDCNGCDWQTEGRHEGFKKPQWAFLPSIGISNLIEVRGFEPLWDGDLLVSSLKAETLYRIRLDGNRPIYASPIPIGERIRDLTQLQDNTIALWTDTGKIIFLKPGAGPSPADLLLTQLPEQVKQTVQDCKVCHSLNPNNSQRDRLSLWGIMGRGIGGQSGFNYSTALLNRGGSWTPGTLDRFLESPATYMPGTSMAYSGIPDPAMRQAVIEFLKKLK